MVLIEITLYIYTFFFIEFQVSIVLKYCYIHFDSKVCIVVVCVARNLFPPKESLFGKN